MSMGLGGNPYGPAGTGKTESVKALGGLFARQVLVFNCDEVCNCMYMHGWVILLTLVVLSPSLTVKSNFSINLPRDE